MAFFDENLEKNTIRDGYATPKVQANPHLFTTEGLDSEHVAMWGRNIKAAVSNFMTVQGEVMDAGAAWQRAAYMPEGASITPEDYHAALPGAIIPYEQANPITTGGASNLIGGFVEKSPALLLGLVNPAAAVMAVGAMSYGENMGEAKAMGLDYEQSKAYAAAGALPDMAGAILPGGGSGAGSVVRQIGSRFIGGAATNIAGDRLSSWSRAGVLDSFGFHAEAQQQRHYDMMQAVSTGIFGGLLNNAPHIGGYVKRGLLNDAALHTRVADHANTESAPGIPATHESRQAHYRASDAVDEALANGRPVDVSQHVNESHTFVGKTPEQLQAETVQHWHADLDEKLANGEITPAQHAAKYDKPPTYEEARRGFDNAEEGQTGSRAYINELRQAANDARVNSGTTESAWATADGATPKPSSGRVVDALESDDHLLARIEEARSVANQLAEADPQRAAEMHATLDQAEAAHRTEMAEHEQYNVAASCAISFGL